MSDKKRTDKIVLLARQREPIFHTQDLMVLWEVFNKNTLYTTIKRLVKNGALYRIQKGMYSLLPVTEIDPWLLGVKALHGFGYVSTETMLSKYGVINQLGTKITLVGGKSAKFQLQGHDFICRKLSDQFLYNNLGIMEVDGVRQASLERAAADILYFNPSFHFDNKKLLEWETVNKLQKEIYDLA